MNNFYGHNAWQPVSSSSPQSSFSSISPPSSLTGHSKDFNLTTSSFSHYSTRNEDDRIQLTRHLSDTRLDFRPQPYPTNTPRPMHRTPIRLERRSPFVYRDYVTTHRARSPIKKPRRIVLSGLNNSPVRAYPRTPRRTWKRHQKPMRSDSSSSEEVQQIAITIPRSILDQNRCCESRSRSDEGFCASEENQAETDFEDAKTDFMNATDKIYENIRLQQCVQSSSLPRHPPPEVRQTQPIVEDEPMIYGRLTALLLSNARSMPKTRCKIAQTQAEIKSLLHILAHVNLCVEDDLVFSRNCALFGHQVAAQLRYINQRSPAEFQLQVKKLHKLLYGLKKKNVLFGGIGNFIQKILKRS